MHKIFTDHRLHIKTALLLSVFSFSLFYLNTGYTVTPSAWVFTMIVAYPAVILLSNPVNKRHTEIDMDNFPSELSTRYVVHFENVLIFDEE